MIHVFLLNMLRSIAVYTVYLSILAGGLTGMHYTIDYMTTSIDSILIPCQHGTEYRSDLGRCDCVGTPFTGKFCEECTCENGGICNTIDVTTPFLTSTFGCKCPTLFFGTTCQHCFANDTDTCTGVCQDGYTGFRCHRRCDPDMTIGDLFSSALNEEQAKCKQLYETIGANCNVCSGHGSCNANSECECEAEWYDTPDGRGKCARSCGDCGHGTCQLVGGVLGCRCEAGWSGEGCDIPCPGALDNNICGGHGSCVGTTCDCIDNYYGPNCNLTCPEPNCNGNGDCLVENDQAVCNCRPAFKGPACNCTLTSCHYHGDCDDAGVCKCRGNFDPATNCETCLPNYWGESCSHFCDAQTCNGHGTCLLKDPGLRSERIECGCDDGFDPSANCLDCYDDLYPKFATVGDIVTQIMFNDGVQRACEIEITDQTCNHRGKGNPLYGTQPNMCTCDTIHLDESTDCARCEPNYFPQPGLDVRHCTNWCTPDASLPATCATSVDYYNDQRVDMFDLRCLHASGNGICDERGTPICDPGFSGEFCNRRCANNCNGHGTCGQDRLQELLEFTIEVPGSDIYLYTCECDEGYYGEDCEYSCPRPPFADPQECNGIGECEQIEIAPGYTCYDDNDCGNVVDGVLTFTGSVLSQDQQAQLRSTLSLGFTKEMGPYCHKNNLPQSLDKENFKCVNLTDMAFNCSALDAVSCETHSGCGYRDQCTFDSKTYCYDYLSAQKPDVMYHDECKHIQYNWVQTCTDYDSMVDYYETTYPECTVNYMSLYTSNAAHWDTVVSLTTDPYDDVTYCWQRKDMNNPFSTEEQLWSGYGERTRFQGTSTDVTELCTNLTSAPTYQVTQPQPVYDCEGELRATPNQFVCNEVTAESLGEDFKPYVLNCMDGDRHFQNWTEAWDNMQYGCDIVVDPLLGRLVVPENRFETVRAVCDAAVPVNDGCAICPNTTECVPTPLGVDCHGDITTVPDACTITGVTTLSCNVTVPDPEPWYDICGTGSAKRVRVWIHIADTRPYTLIFGNESVIVYFVNGGIFLNQVTELESCPIGEGECHDTYELGWYLVTLEIDQGLTFTMGDIVLEDTISGDIANYQFNGDSKHFEVDTDVRCEFLHRLRYPHPWTGDILDECKFLSHQTLPGPHDWEAYCDERAQYVDKNCHELDFTLDEIKAATPLLTIFDKGVCLKRYLEDTTKPTTVQLQDQGTCRMSQISIPSFCTHRNTIYGGNGLIIPENTCEFDPTEFRSEDWDDWCSRVTKHTQPGVCAGVMCNCHSEVNLGISGDSCQLYCDVHADGSPCGEKSDAGVCSYTQKQAEALRSGFIFEKGSTSMRGECKCFLDSANRVCEVNCDPEICPPQNYNVSYFNYTVEMKTATCDRTTGGCNCLPPYIGEFQVNKTTWTGHTIHVSTFQGFPYTLKREGEPCTADQECQEGACGVLCGKKVRSCEEMGMAYDWSNASQNEGQSCTYDRDTCTGDDIAYYPTNARFYDAHTLCADLCDDNPRCQCFTIRTQDNVCILKDGQETRRRLSSVTGSLQGDMYVYENVDASCVTSQSVGDLDMCKRLCIGDCTGFFFDGSHCDIASERCALFTGARTFYAKMETGYVYTFQNPIVKMREGPATQVVAGVDRLSCAHIAYNANCTTFESQSTFDLGLFATFNATTGFNIGTGYATRIDNECQVFENSRKGFTAGSEMQIGSIQYGGQASWDECLEACRTTLACKQIVFVTGYCYAMRVASDHDDHMDSGVTYKSAHCNKLESVSGVRLDEPMTVTFNADLHVLGAFVGVNSHEDLQFTNDTVILPDGTSFPIPLHYAKWMLDVTPEHLMFGYIDTLSRKHILHTEVENPVLPGDFTAHIISQQQQSGTIEQVSVFPTNPPDTYDFKDILLEENYVRSVRVWHHDTAYESELVASYTECPESVYVGSQQTLEACARAAYDAYPSHEFFLFNTGACFSCPPDSTSASHFSLHKFKHRRSPLGRVTFIKHYIDACPEGHAITDAEMCKSAANMIFGTGQYGGVFSQGYSDIPSGCGYSGSNVHYNTNMPSTIQTYPSSWGDDRGSICVYYDTTVEDMVSACGDLRVCTEDEVLTHELTTGMKLGHAIHCCRDTFVYHNIPVTVPDTYKITMNRGSFGTSDAGSEGDIEWYDSTVDCQTIGKERPTDLCGASLMLTRKTALYWNNNHPWYMSPPGEPEACEKACSEQEYSHVYEYGDGECLGDEYHPFNNLDYFEDKGSCRLSSGHLTYPTATSAEACAAQCVYGQCNIFAFHPVLQICVVGDSSVSILDRPGLWAANNALYDCYQRNEYHEMVAKCADACTNEPGFVVHTSRRCVCEKQDISTCTWYSPGSYPWTRYNYKKNDLEVKKTCNLEYCNQHTDLQNSFCSGTTCTTSTQSDSCGNHWRDYGANEGRAGNPVACALKTRPVNYVKKTYIDETKTMECNLAYCNQHTDLQNAFCGGHTCTTSAQSDSCGNHWRGSWRDRTGDPVACASITRPVNYEFIREGHCPGFVVIYDGTTLNPGTTWDEKLHACAEACIDYVGFIILPQGVANEGYCDCSTVETPCTSLHDGSTSGWHRYDYIDNRCQSFEWSETGCYMTPEALAFREIGDYDAWYSGRSRNTWVQLRDDTWQEINSCEINSADSMLTQDETVNIKVRAWSFCVLENGICNCQGGTRFGKDDTWVTRVFDTDFSCTTETFGDPLPGVPKICQCSVEASVTIPTATACVNINRDDVMLTQDETVTIRARDWSEAWSFCVHENGLCNCYGETARFGEGDVWITKTFDGTFSCTSESFGGDPLYGVMKECQCSGEASVNVPGHGRLDSDYNYYVAFTDKLTIGYEHPVWEKTELYSEPTSISTLTVKSIPTMFHFRGKRHCIGTSHPNDLTTLDACMAQCDDDCVAIGFCPTDNCNGDLNKCVHFSNCIFSTADHSWGDWTYYKKTKGSDIHVVKDTTKPLPNICGQRVEPSGAIVQTFDVDQCKCQQLCEEHGCASWMWDGQCHFKDGIELYDSNTLYGGLGGSLLQSCDAMCSGDFSIESDTLYDMSQTIVESETDYIIHKDVTHANLDAVYPHSASRLDGTPHPYRLGDTFKGFTVAEISKESTHVPGSIVRDTVHWYMDDGAASYADREQDCANKGLGLCTYDQICPYGKHHMPTESLLRQDFWTPIRTEANGNQWVSIAVGTLKALCDKLSISHASDPASCWWCHRRSISSWKRRYACCEPPLPTTFVTTKDQCAEHTAREGKSHFELGDMLYVRTIGGYEYTKPEAESACAADGMQLCSRAQHINGVIRKQIRSVCSNGWLTDDAGWYQLDDAYGCGTPNQFHTIDSSLRSAHCCARQCTPTDIGPLKAYHSIGHLYCTTGLTYKADYTGKWDDVVEQCASSCTGSPAFMVSDARYHYGKCWCIPSLDFSSCSGDVLDNTGFVTNGYDVSNYYHTFAFSTELFALAPTHMGFGHVYALYRGRVNAGETIVSRNKDYIFMVGVGVHHTNGPVIWSDTSTSLTIEDNNNLVWCGTECQTIVLGGSAGANSRLELGNDGILIFYDHLHVPLWRSDTGVQTLDTLAAQGFVKTNQFIIGPTPGQCYCTDHGIPYKQKHECRVCADDDEQRQESGALIFNESHVYAHENGAFEVVGKPWIFTEQFDPFMSYVKNDRFEMTYAACEESAQELSLPFGQTMEDAEMRRGCIVVSGTVYWNIIGTEIGSTPGICADLDGCSGSEPCKGDDCYVYRRIGEACEFNRECKTQTCDKTGEFGCKGKCVVVNPEAGGFGNCPSPQNYRKRVAMMQGPDFFMRYVNSSVSQYQTFLRDPGQFMCGAAQCTPYDAVLLQHLSMSGYTYGYDCTSICPGTVGVIPCNGRGRCSKLGKCIADPARVISVTNENTGVRDAMTMGDVTIAAGNVQMSELDRSGVRGDALDLICPGYDLDARDMRTVCGGHGVCSTTAECTCAVGYSGEGCQFTCPGFTGQSNECSGHGVCESVLVTEPSIDNRDTYYSVANSWMQWQEQCEPFETINRIEIAFAGALGDIELVDVHGNVVQPKKITFV